LISGISITLAAETSGRISEWQSTELGAAFRAGISFPGAADYVSRENHLDTPYTIFWN
jgi:hypothetical protein